MGRHASTSTLALALCFACVFGYRGEVEFSDDAALTGLDTVQLQLPATELTLTGDPDRSTISWQGAWVTLGGSSADSLRGAREAALIWETWDAVGRLVAGVPAEIRDITSLDHLEVQTAAGLAHEIVGAGDVRVVGVDGYLYVNLDGGDVEVDGGVEQLVIRTRAGDVILETEAAVDVRTRTGSVWIRSAASGEIIVDANGEVLVELAEVANIAIDIADAGEIIVDLDGISHVGAGSYARAIGPATRDLRIRPDGHRVELRMLELDEQDTDG